MGTRPEIVSAQEWRAARRDLLAKEKEFTRARDALSAQRRRLPMTEVTEDYRFIGPDGEVGLADLFEGRRQLLVYHFMFEPDWDAGCPSCSFVVDNIGPVVHLHARNTSLALVSRAPYEKLAAYRKRMGWDLRWYSSYGSEFNDDFGVTIDPAKGHTEYNFRDRSQDEGWQDWSGEMPGVSAFLRDGDRILRTYSSYERGVDILLNTYNWLDLTALGRQEDDGVDWLRRHDEYEPGQVSNL
jgi:predicted dithiol-disulfide oxidoreductase (DUF899 family)